MDTPQDAQPGTTTLLGHIAALVPDPFGALIAQEAPILSLSAARLGLEVLDAERRNINFSVAVERSAEFPLMGRVYFGALNLLQWTVPHVMRDTLCAILSRAIDGEFESTRKLLFIIARRKDDPEAALCRFLLWSAVRINLVILTWHLPQVEAIGVLDGIEDRTEAVLRQLVGVEDIDEPDCRPLHILIAKALQDAQPAAAPLLAGAMTTLEAENIDALQMIRGLDARDAAIFNPGRFTGAPGSQQIFDRFPQHQYASIGAIEQQRTRIRKRIGSAGNLNPPADRFIDLILDLDRS